MTEQEIKNIALKFFQGKATPEEEEVLHQWYETKGHASEELIVPSESERSEDVRERLFDSIQARMERDDAPDAGPRRSGKGWIIAASFLLFSSLAGLYFYAHQPVEQHVHYTQLLEGDVGPGGNNARISLGDGRVLNLDAAGIGELGSVGGMRISKQADGILSIEFSGGEKHAAIQTNTITTPAGGQYQVKLPDGTSVWLNASSSISFPSSFSKASREVELTGEAYFEVAKVLNNNQSVPFFVLNKEQRIAVLGTQFNVYDYPGEGVKTTLVEGSVRVHSLVSNASELLKPGQQSQFVNGGIQVKAADMESTLSWKEGDFIFTNEELPSIMKKLARWYDVEVEYKGPMVSRKFSGAVSRSRNLSEVLKIMEYTGKVTFKIEGRRVTVMM